MIEHDRIGFVDMGSNAIRFMIAETSGSKHRIVESHRLAVRLGQGVFQDGQIPESAIADSVDAFRRFRASCDRLDVKRTRVIATSAMRDARNRQQLIDRVRKATGFEIEVISGTQEAYLLKLGVEQQIDLSSGRSLLVDVGGGSVEVVVIDDGDVTSANSYRLGALRMLKLFSDAEGPEFADLLEQHLQGLQHRIREHFDQRHIDRYAAVGGNIDSLADLVSSRTGLRTNCGHESCSIADLAKETSSLAKLTVNERIDQLGLRPDRADTILPAGLVYLHLGKLAKQTEILIPRAGVKEGLLKEVVNSQRNSFAAEDHVDVALASCRAMGSRLRYEAGHAEAVLTLSQQIFDGTEALHGFEAHARVLLQAAALLHDVGVSVNNDGHHKHSQYLIESTELVGLSDDERHLIALITRYHRKAIPSRDHTDYMDLKKKDRSMVAGLAGILRIADALDRQHAGVVSGVGVEIKDQHVELRPKLAENGSTLLTLEAKAVTRKASLFENAFGRKVVLMLPQSTFEDE